MIDSDRDRLIVGVGIALALHLLLVGVLAVVGLDFTPYPENEPVFVTLPDYDEPVPSDPPPNEPEPITTQPEPVQPEIEPVQPEPEAVQPQPSREPAQPRAEPARPEVSPAPSTAPEIRSEPAVGRDAPEGSFGRDDLPWLENEAVDADRERSSSDDLFAIDEPDSVTSDLPSWVVEGEFSLQPESTLDEDEREELDAKRDTVPGFSERLNELVRAIENPTLAPRPGDAGDTDGGDGTGPSSDPTAIPGGGSIEWVGSGTRRPVGELTLPRLTASDFGGEVPARISFLVVFDVNEDGLVVPGSLILRQSSGYTLADQKVRRAVSSWRFDPAPGTRPVTAIATLHIARDQVR